jgi:hypothetical protein
MNNWYKTQWDKFLLKLSICKSAPNNNTVLTLLFIVCMFNTMAKSFSLTKILHWIKFWMSADLKTNKSLIQILEIKILRDFNNF